MYPHIQASILMYICLAKLSLSHTHTRARAHTHTHTHTQVGRTLNWRRPYLRDAEGQAGLSIVRRHLPHVAVVLVMCCMCVACVLHVCYMCVACVEGS